MSRLTITRPRPSTTVAVTGASAGEANIEDGMIENGNIEDEMIEDAQTTATEVMIDADSASHSAGPGRNSGPLRCHSG
jgi:hypothetical protein